MYVGHCVTLVVSKARHLAFSHAHTESLKGLGNIFDMAWVESTSRQLAVWAGVAQEACQDEVSWNAAPGLQ